MHWLITLIIVFNAGDAVADGFRCGNRLIVTGDPVSRLERACGLPDRTLKARAELGDRGVVREVPVTQWIYSRARKRDMIVSIRGGEVVRIERG